MEVSTFVFFLFLLKLKILFNLEEILLLHQIYHIIVRI